MGLTASEYTRLVGQSENRLFIQIGAGAGDLDSRSEHRDGFSQLLKELTPALSDRIIVIEPNPFNISALEKS